MMRYTYYQYGLKIHSELELKDLSCKGDAPHGEVEIIKGVISKYNLGSEIAPNAWGNNLDTTIFHPEIGYSKVINGSKIIIDESINSLSTFQSIYVSSQLLSLILVQKGFLVLHASAVALNGRAILFTGAGGSGKSSLAALLSKSGGIHLADDVCPIFFSSYGDPFIYEGSKGWYAVRNEKNGVEEKQYIKLPLSESPPKTYPLDFIFSLKAGNYTAEKELINLESFKAILSNLWFPVFSQKTLGKDHLYLASKVHSKVQTIELQRDVNSTSWVKWNSSVNHFLDKPVKSSPKSFNAIEVC